MPEQQLFLCGRHFPSESMAPNLMMIFPA